MRRATVPFGPGSNPTSMTPYFFWFATALSEVPAGHSHRMDVAEDSGLSLPVSVRYVTRYEKALTDEALGSPRPRALFGSNWTAMPVRLLTVALPVVGVTVSWL